MAVSLQSAAAANQSAAAQGLRAARGAGGQRVDQAPERAGGGEDVGVGQRALRKPDGIEGGEQRRSRRRPRARRPGAWPAARPRQAERGDHQHGLARDLGTEAEELPPERQIDAGQRRMGVGQRGDGNQRAGAEEVPGGGNVVAGLVPVVGQAQQGEVAGIERRKDHRKDHPGGKGRVRAAAAMKSSSSASGSLLLS